MFAFFLSPKLEAPNVLLCLHEQQYRQRAKKPVDKLESETNPKPVLLNMNEDLWGIQKDEEMTGKLKLSISKHQMSGTIQKLTFRAVLQRLIRGYKWPPKAQFPLQH